jgi:hypothetical protein
VERFQGTSAAGMLHDDERMELIDGEIINRTVYCT